MATPVTGVTATWNNVDIGEVVDIKVVHGGQMPATRSGTPWAVDAGTIDISCLATATGSATSPAEYGLKRTLAIAGGGLTYTTKAVLQRLELVGKVNDVARYAMSFKRTPE